jgi:heat shock protein HslJ
MNPDHQSQEPMRTLHIVCLTAGLCAVAAACRTGGTDRTELDGVNPITLQDVANLSYDGIYEEPVPLQDGRWEGEPFVPEGAARPSVRLVDRLWRQGDVNGDGRDEAVVLLAESSGGSGSYLYIAAVGRRDDGLVNLGTALVGDRVQVRALRIGADQVELDVVQAGPRDAACCPTQKATRAWQLRPEGLVELAARICGTLSAADLESVTWVLTHMTWNEPVPEDPEVSIEFSDGQVSGSAGCNRYLGGVAESSPGQISVGALSATRMVCPGDVMELETRYLAALANVQSYSFLAGQLALTFVADDDVLTLLFEPR